MNADNVLIEHRRAGILVETRSVHNVWTSVGKAYLSQLVAFQVIDDAIGDFPQEDHRIKYFGVGIGGNEASGIAYETVLATAYPPGEDPVGTAGNAYNKINPTGPLITTLERPVRFTGSTQPYPSALSSDVWLSNPLVAYYRDINSVTFRTTLDGSSGILAYSPFTILPISEAGLFNSAASPNLPYNAALAYVNFNALFFQSDSVITFSWTVRFAS